MTGMASLRNAYRVKRFRRAGVSIGKDVQIGCNVRMTGNIKIGDGTILQDDAFLQGRIVIGKNCRIEKFVEMSGNVEIGGDTVVGGYSYLSTMPSGSLKIGQDVLVNAFSIVGASDRVEIGDHCIFAAYVHINDSAHGIDDPDALIKHAPWRGEPVWIGKNVWLGSAVMIAMGAKIGEGSVIGAKSMVNSEIPAMSVAYGVPARVMRDRRAARVLPS
jgi:acetyltransferase-like isoleucine patch superfamily enzyme